MKILKITLFIFPVVLYLSACGADGSTGKGAAGESADQPISTNTLSASRLVSWVNNLLTIEGEEPLELKEYSDQLTVVLVRPAETLGTRSSLSPEGQKRADRLSGVLGLSGVEQIFCDGNASMQTAVLTSRITKCPLGLIKGKSAEEIVSFLLKNFKGKKVMVVVAPDTLTQLLALFSGKNDFTIPDDKYDPIFIIQAREQDKAVVYQFRY